MNLLHAALYDYDATKRYLSSSYVDEYRNIHIVLNRMTFIKDIFDMVITQDRKYGEKKEAQDNNILINCTLSRDELTVGQLRNILLCCHMGQVLKQNR